MLFGAGSNGKSVFLDTISYIMGSYATNMQADVEITLTTNGGSVFAGQEIYDIIKNHEGKTTVKLSGLVASIGTMP